MKYAMFDLFNKTTHGIPEPDNISGLEGELLIKGNRAGLIFAVPYKGKLWKYDFVSRYPSKMITTKCIPMKAGYFDTIDQTYIDQLATKQHTPSYGL